MYKGVLDSNSKIVQSSLNWYLDASQLRSYPGSGTTWTNLYGTGKNGTLVNSPVFSNLYGGAFRFDGWNAGSYVDFGSNPGGNGIYSPTALSFSTWIYSPSPNYYYLGQMNIAFTGVYGGASYGLQMYLAVGGGLVTARWAIKRSQGDIADISYDISYYNFYNLVGTYDGTNSKLYVNGALVSTSATFSGTVINLPGTSFGLCVNSGDQAPFSGYMYNAIMYNKALSATEVLQNYTVTKKRFGL